jgi:predicted transcriptional regulator
MDHDRMATNSDNFELEHQDFYHLSDEKWVAVQEGLAEAERGEFVSDEDMAAFSRSMDCEDSRCR